MELKSEKLTSKNFFELEEKYGANNYHPLDCILTKGEGCWLEDVEGNKYLDCLASYSAVNQGHCHPRILKTMVSQASKLTLTSRAFRNDQLPLLEKELCDLFGYEKMIPMNSGAEAVETALKVARKWGYKVKKVEEDKGEIIACKGNFHGRTISIISFSDDAQYKDGFGPLTTGFKLIEYGDSEALEKAINKNTIAFIVEPIQGEGGVLIPPQGYLKKCSEICKKNNVLFIADEIQSGFGRTGKLLCSWHEDVKPDMITLGKALSGGFYPVSAMLTSKEVMDVLHPGDHGSTFGGNPLACAIAREAIKIIIEEKLSENSATLGAYLLEELSKIKSPHINVLRGKGLWIGIVLKESAKGARRFCEALMKKGILAKETHHHIIRLAPPLIVKKEELDFLIKVCGEVLTMP